MSDDAEVDFFGAHIKVKSARLVALLNSAVSEDVVVVGKRAHDLVSPEEREDEVNEALDGIEASRRTGAASAPVGDGASGESTAGPTIRER